VRCTGQERLADGFDERGHEQRGPTWSLVLASVQRQVCSVGPFYRGRSIRRGFWESVALFATATPPTIMTAPASATPVGTSPPIK
jgi:hypothetical protein